MSPNNEPISLNLLYQKYNPFNVERLRLSIIHANNEHSIELKKSDYKITVLFHITSHRNDLIIE